MAHSGYEECIVSFLDILGFRNLLESAQPSEIANTLAIFPKASLPHEKESKRKPEQIGYESRVRVEIVSDAVVRARTMAARYRGGHLFWELLDLLHIQIACVANGIAVRGAVTVGALHLGDDLGGPVFGPALVRAYEMESKEVVFPRIAVDEAVLDRLRSDESMRRDGHSLEQELEYYNELLDEDQSGLHYIDYLRAARAECEDYDEYTLFLEHHRDLVERVQGSGVHNPKVRRKYTWLRNYHNRRLRAESEKHGHPVRDKLNSLLYPT